MASFLCAIHCAGTGLALGLLSSLGLAFLTSKWVEVVFFTLAIGMGFWAAFRGWKSHRTSWPIGLLALGMGCLLVSHFVLGHSHAPPGSGHAHSRPWESALLSALGGLILVGFHLANARLMARQCRLATPRSPLGSMPV